MKFEDALKAMREGKIVKSPKYDSLFQIHNGKLMWYDRDDEEWSSGDLEIEFDEIMGEWEIVPQKVKRVGWVNLYAREGRVVPSSQVFPSEREAEYWKSSEYLATVFVTWEETTNE